MSERRALPQRRHSETMTFVFWGQPWSVTFGFYEDHKTVGEVFIAAAKSPGSDLDATARDAAILISLGLQYGIPIEVIKGALTREPNGDASSIAGRVVDFITFARRE